jgi:hypothetical protein
VLFAGEDVRSNASRTSLFANGQTRDMCFVELSSRWASARNAAPRASTTAPKPSWMRPFVGSTTNCRDARSPLVCPLGVTFRATRRTEPHWAWYTPI